MSLHYDMVGYCFSNNLVEYDEDTKWIMIPVFTADILPQNSYLSIS